MNMADMIPEDLPSVLRALKAEIMREINCVAIGKVKSVNFDAQTVEAEIVYKRVFETGEIKDYPVLLDVPFVVLQGGGSYFEMPIAKGDGCVIFFNDRNFSTWWDSGNEKEPENARKHSMSDGIALVGINPKTRALGLDGQAARLVTDKKFEVDAQQINLNGDSKSFVTYAELNQALTTFMTALNAHTHVVPQSPSGSQTSAPPTSPMQLNISAAETTTVKTGG